MTKVWLRYWVDVEAEPGADQSQELSECLDTPGFKGAIVTGPYVPDFPKPGGTLSACFTLDKFMAELGNYPGAENVLEFGPDDLQKAFDAFGIHPDSPMVIKEKTDG